jgi:hypothetical protein
MYMKVGDESHVVEGLSLMNKKEECKGDFLFFTRVISVEKRGRLPSGTVPCYDGWT